MNTPEHVTQMSIDTFTAITRMQKNIVAQAFEYMDKIPDDTTITGVCQFTREELGLNISPEKMFRILALYPFQRSKLAEYGWEDTEIRDLVADVISQFFLRCDWPRNKDNIDPDLFTERLKLAAKIMGY